VGGYFEKEEWSQDIDEISDPHREQHVCEDYDRKAENYNYLRHVQGIADAGNGRSVMARNCDLTNMTLKPVNVAESSNAAQFK